MAASLDTRIKDHWASLGMRPLDPAVGLACMEAAMSSGAARRLALDADWSKWIPAIAEFENPALYTWLKDEARTTPKAREERKPPSPASKLDFGAGPEREAGLGKYLLDQLCSFTGLRQAEVDLSVPLANLGLDSLMALELKNKIESDLGIAIPMLEFVRNPNLLQLGETALRLYDERLKATVVRADRLN